MVSRAKSTRSSSSSESPTPWPIALMNVAAMPPPMTSTSTRSSSVSSTAILSDTLAPPMIAANGRFGFSRTPPSIVSSRSMRKAAHRGQERRDARSRGVGAVRCAKGVVDVEVSQPS